MAVCNRIWLVLALGFFVSFASDASVIEKSSFEKYRVMSQKGLLTPVLNARFARDSRFELGLGGSYSPYSNLIKYYAVNGSLQFHFNRRHAIEPIYFGWYKPSVSNFTKTQVAEKFSSSPTDTEAPKMHFLASYLFSPYYSKMHITKRSVAHFDVFLGLGGGMTKTKLFLSQESGGVVNVTEGQNFWRPTLALSAGIRFLMPSRFSIRFEFRDFMYKTRNFNRSIFGNSLQMSLMFSIFFPSFPKARST